MKKWLVIIFMGLVTCAVAQESPPIALSPTSSPSSNSELDKRLDLLEQHVNNQELLSLRRVEGVEGLITSLDHNINRVLLIFGLAMFLALALIISYHRAQTRLSSERVNRAVREAESLMRDIHGDLLRPEMEFLRIGHFLRQIMRNFFEQTPDSAAISQMRVYGRDPNLPMSLHCISQALIAEHEKRWNDAAKMLEQLRQLEPKDPFVLLHLSGVHRKISDRYVDIPERQKHTKLANQYYAQYAMIVRLESAHLPTTPAPQPHKAAAPPPISSPTATPLNGKTPQPQIAPPPIPAPAVLSMPEQNISAAQNDAQIAPPPTPSPAVLSMPEQNISAVQNNAQTAPPPTPASMPKQNISAAQNNAQTASANVSAKPAAAILPKMAMSVPPAANGRAKQSGKISLQSTIISPMQAKQVVGKAGLIFKSGYTNLIKNFRGATNLLNSSSDKMPFLPVPGLSTVPEKAETAAELDMWIQIRRGDLCIAHAENVMSIRRRNHIIDKALTHYAKAQVHKTNETLYLNWGLAFLGKALHLPEKKRDPFFNAAIDKFLAGNVISPHQFDFVLASLYGIIGHANDCRKWLKKSQESGKLNQESLRSAPDFDNMRNLPWFAEFMRD